MDASVAVKWFVAEEHFQPARSLVATPVHALFAPDFVLLEAANAFVAKARRGELRADEVAENVDGIRDQLDLVPADSLVEEAISIALAHNCSVYSSLYVALARQEGCQLVTADESLYAAFKVAFPQTMLWVGDLTS